jgi:hypothetical protein
MRVLDQLPWDVPVAVRRSAFVPLDPWAERYNREVDPAAMGPFGYRGAESEVALCDQQSCADVNVALRLGSGRAAFVEGAYVKGVGRTPLCAGWASGRDPLHASGHLLASGAVHELLATAYLRGRGADDAIVPCASVLVRPLDRRLAGFADHAFAGAPAGAIAPCDRALQALTVKRGRFSRWSNLHWLAHQLTPRMGVAPLFWAMNRVLPGAGTAPERLADRLGAALHQGLACFRRYLAAGIFWGSFHNNVALDGRFVDLEVPAVLGGPTLGVLGPDRGPTLQPTGAELIGCAGLEAIAYLEQARAFVEALTARLGWIADRAGGAPREFTRAFLGRLGAATAETPIGSPERGEAVVVAWLAALVADDPAAVEVARRLVRARASAGAHGPARATAPCEVVFDRVDAELPAAEPGRPLALYLPRGAREPDAARSRRARWSAAVRHVVGAAEPDELLARLHAARATLAASDPITEERTDARRARTE